MKNTYLVFTIQAFIQEMPDGRLTDSCTLELIAESEKEAVAKAKKLIKKPFYRIQRVFENYHAKS